MSVRCHKRGEVDMAKRSGVSCNERYRETRKVEYGIERSMDIIERSGASCNERGKMGLETEGGCERYER